MCRFNCLRKLYNDCGAYVNTHVEIYILRLHPQAKHKSRDNISRLIFYAGKSANLIPAQRLPQNKPAWRHENCASWTDECKPGRQRKYV